ncbi:MAG TPA: hypothetical protein VGI39_01650 [Polyangiaceae bacterium]
MSAAPWLRGFALTLGVEEAIGIPLLAPVEPSRGRRAMAVLLVNLATHPLVWFFFTHLGWPRLAVILAAEGWAFGFEILGYRVIFPAASWRRCALVSVAANLASYALGVLAIEAGLLR